MGQEKLGGFKNLFIFLLPFFIYLFIYCKVAYEICPNCLFQRNYYEYVRVTGPNNWFSNN